jgi:hypothetical protein
LTIEAVALVDSSPQYRPSSTPFPHGSVEVIIQHGKLFLAERHNIQIIVRFQFGHVDFGILVDTELVVGIYIQVVPGIRLTKDK